MGCFESPCKECAQAVRRSAGRLCNQCKTAIILPCHQRAAGHATHPCKPCCNAACMKMCDLRGTMSIRPAFCSHIIPATSTDSTACLSITHLDTLARSPKGQAFVVRASWTPPSWRDQLTIDSHMRFPNHPAQAAAHMYGAKLRVPFSRQAISAIDSLKYKSWWPCVAAWRI